MFNVRHPRGTSANVLSWVELSWGIKIQRVFVCICAASWVKCRSAVMSRLLSCWTHRINNWNIFFIATSLKCSPTLLTTSVLYYIVYSINITYLTRSWHSIQCITHTSHTIAFLYFMPMWPWLLTFWPTVILIGDRSISVFVPSSAILISAFLVLSCGQTDKYTITFNKLLHFVTLWPWPLTFRRMCAWTRSFARELIPILRPLSRQG